MSKSVGERLVLSVIICIFGLGVVILHAQIASTNAEVPSEVRRMVDPTVLPLVPPPGAPAEESEPVATGEEEIPVELPDLPVSEEPAPEPDPKAEPAPTPKPAPVAKPTPTPAPAPKAGIGTVTAATLTNTDTGFILTVQCDRPVGDTSYLNLSNPRRLVIDMRQPWDLKTKNVIRSSTGAIKHIVVGAHPDRLRFVVHFRKAPAGKLEPSFTREGNRLVVRVDL
ncbi:AMIN domain-containing protein [Pseudodesulfovibrio sp. zrk46]|uniref:AMIN domain-containing protein n=1 Tax=Pseudodesulfovibrio sp. zrk46 TaxID=2725288 RepID=UPI001448F3D7|nr:AMIN domain-containing protein [Pseudodesulfovibrio sp. zrk46]QJB56328.1 AMIN domain-containing protein [Pseudodesulfovibrio sp. zrk46]